MMCVFLRMYYNSAVLFSPKKAPDTDEFPVNYQVYNKNHLVPFLKIFRNVFF